MSIRPVELALLGAGSRGTQTFGGYALRHPERMRFVAVAEPDDQRRKAFCQAHKIDPSREFKRWEDLLAQDQLAPGLINATMDQLHFDSTMAALDLGYHVLLEKPLAEDPVSCVRLVRKARKARRILQVGFTLRYAPFFVTLKRMLEEGQVGQLLHIDHCEQVAYWHMAHAFVRGNWGRVADSAPMILTKCSHDMDLLCWMVDAPPRKVASFGMLSHFKADRVGPEIPERCTDGCPIEADCPYSSIKTYLTAAEVGEWIATAAKLPEEPEARRAALETSPYGRCVYRCDNDVVDHQTVAIEFAGDVTANLTMQGHSFENTRTMRYSGTDGEVRGHANKFELAAYNFATGHQNKIQINAAYGGHGGGDPRLANEFTEAVRADDPRLVLASGEAGLPGHLLCFAAEKARVTGQVVDMDEYRRETEAQADQAELG